METAQKWLMATSLIAFTVSIFGFVPWLMGYETAAIWTVGLGLGVGTLLTLLACFLLIFED